jgi:hypothetical protein
VTWSDRDRAAALSWTLAGGTYDPTAVDVTTISQENVWANWDLTALGVHWLTVDNYGLILEAPATIPKSEVKFRSSDDGSSEQRPRLQVCYWP